MAAGWPEAFEREMACTEADWLRWLPAAIGGHAWTREGSGAVIALSPGSLRLTWRAGEPRAIALMRFPRLHVSFRFERAGEAERRAFMERFDLYLQRGGG